MNTINNWQESDMIEILLREPDDFLKVKETLTRIGIPSIRENSKNLYQSCHILHKRGRYYIVHFKELYKLDGKESNYSIDDKIRTETIAKLLSDWSLLSLVIPGSNTPNELKEIKVVSFKEKSEWNLEPKYTIGTKS